MAQGLFSDNFGRDIAQVRGEGSLGEARRERCKRVSDRGARAADTRPFWGAHCHHCTVIIEPRICQVIVLT